MVQNSFAFFRLSELCFLGNFVLKDMVEFRCPRYPLTWRTSRARRSIHGCRQPRQNSESFSSGDFDVVRSSKPGFLCVCIDQYY